MNYIMKDFNYNYISQRVKLKWRDILYGIQKGYISPQDAIQHATNIVSKKEQYCNELFELACLSENELIYPYVNKLVAFEDIQEEDITKDKWMYLILDWLYNNRDNFLDPLEVVEEIYADFDYPEKITSFVRYMPSNEPDLGSIELNITRMYINWGKYLKHEKERFF